MPSFFSPIMPRAWGVPPSGQPTPGDPPANTKRLRPDVVPNAATPPDDRAPMEARMSPDQQQMFGGPIPRPQPQMGMFGLPQGGMPQVQHATPPPINFPTSGGTHNMNPNPWVSYIMAENAARAPVQERAAASQLETEALGREATQEQLRYNPLHEWMNMQSGMSKLHGDQLTQLIEQQKLGAFPDTMSMDKLTTLGNLGINMPGGPSNPMLQKAIASEMGKLYPGADFSAPAPTAPSGATAPDNRPPAGFGKTALHTGLPTAAAAAAWPIASKLIGMIPHPAAKALSFVGPLAASYFAGKGTSAAVEKLDPTYAKEKPDTAGSLVGVAGGAFGGYKGGGALSGGFGRAGATSAQPQAPTPTGNGGPPKFGGFPEQETAPWEQQGGTDPTAEFTPQTSVPPGFGAQGAGAAQQPGRSGIVPAEPSPRFAPPSVVQPNGQPTTAMHNDPQINKAVGQFQAEQFPLPMPQPMAQQPQPAPGMRSSIWPTGQPKVPIATNPVQGPAASLPPVPQAQPNLRGGNDLQTIQQLRMLGFTPEQAEAMLQGLVQYGPQGPVPFPPKFTQGSSGL